MFIDKIKYLVIACATTFLSFVFLAGCQAAEDDPQNHGQVSAQDNPVPVILDRISGSACSQLPYEICLVAATVSSIQLEERRSLEVRFFEDDYIMNLVASQDNTEVLDLLHAKSAEETWIELRRMYLEENLSYLGGFLKIQIEMQLLVKELDKKLSNVQWNWVLENKPTMGSAIEKCNDSGKGQRWGSSPQSEFLNICHELEQLYTLLYDYEMRDRNLEELHQGLRELVRSHQVYHQDMFQQIVELAEELVEAS